MVELNKRCVTELFNLHLVEQDPDNGYAANMVLIAGLNAWMTPYTRSSTTEGRKRADAQHRR